MIYRGHVKKTTSSIAHSDETSIDSRSVEGKIDTFDEYARNDAVQTASKDEETRHNTASEDPQDNSCVWIA